MLGAVLAGGFLGGLAENMKENREYVRQKSDAMQEYLSKAGLERQQEVKKARNALTRASDYLTEKGLSRDNLLTILDDDATKVLTLQEAALKAEEDGTLTSTLLNSAVEDARSFGADVTPAELIKKATPVFVEGTEIKKPEKELSVLQKIFSPTTSDELMFDVYSSEIMGTKAADVQASISAPLVRERTGTVKTDIGVFATDTQFTPSEIQKAYNTTKGKIDVAYENITRQALDLLANVDSSAPGSQIITAPNGTEFTVEELRSISNKKVKIDKLLSDQKDYEAYQEIMKLNPSLAQSLISQGTLMEEVFTSPFGFNFDQSFIQDTFGN